MFVLAGVADYLAEDAVAGFLNALVFLLAVVVGLVFFLGGQFGYLLFFFGHCLNIIFNMSRGLECTIRELWLVQANLLRYSKVQGSGRAGE